MRCLNATGTMHNRLRMIVAMFLTKDLLIHWQWGERYFMRQLVDGDLAANNGGWQWSAGTGTDAAPYFRIFNPTSQGEKFDAEGKFVRRWIPEYGSDAYPAPIVDERAAMKHAKDRMYGLRATPLAQAQADAVQQKHGSRKSGLTPTVGKRSAAKNFCGTAASSKGN